MRTVAFVPSAPFLLFGAGPVELRTAIEQALSRLTGEILVVGAAPTQGYLEGSVDLTPYGGPGTPAPDPLPLALAVGRTLLGDRPHRLWGVRPEPSGIPQELTEVDSLLVVADGSAKRSEKGRLATSTPGPRTRRHPRAGAARGFPEQLSALDAGLAAELWATGLPAWRAVVEQPRATSGSPSCSTTRRQTAWATWSPRGRRYRTQPTRRKA